MMDGVDSSVVSDKAGIVESPRGSRRFDMDDDTNSDWSSLHKFKTSCWSHRMNVIPIILSIIAFFFALGAIFAIAVHWHTLNTEIKHLTLIVNSLQSGSDISVSPAAQTQSKPSVGSTYVHWGKSTCNKGATLVYTGFAAGAHTYSDDWGGGGVDYMCLPPNPDYDKYDMKNDTIAHSWLYSTEYMSYNLGIFDDSVHGHNVACSVCHVPRSTTLMVPSKNVCPQTWIKEYNGYLMSSYVGDNKMTIECVDAKPDILGGTQNVTGGSGMFFVSGYCGASGGLSHCPPYVTAREMTCAMCTK